RVDALVVNNDAVFQSHDKQLIALAARHNLPVMYATRRFTEKGGLISYGTFAGQMIHQAGLYVGRILKGEKPADLPVIQPTKFELVVNVKTAKTLGLTIPESFLVRADEVME
ncbi:MAG: ABC transporter substrate binding protein, partial [Xanthobacteraceae bacterium]